MRDFVSILFCLMAVLRSGAMNVEAVHSPDSVCMPVSDDSVCAVLSDKDLTLYDKPYSTTLSMKNWKRLWINTSVLVGAGTATMFVLESLPADATDWNKSENAKIPLFRRWVENVKAGPVWDKDLSLIHI